MLAVEVLDTFCLSILEVSFTPSSTVLQNDIFYSECTSANEEQDFVKKWSRSEKFTLSRVGPAFRVQIRRWTARFLRVGGIISSKLGRGVRYQISCLVFMSDS